MSRATSRRRSMSALDPVAVVVLAVAWCGSWGEFSLANVVSGLAIGVLLRLMLRGESSHRSVHLVSLARLVALVAVDLVKSTASVVYEVLTPTDYTNEKVVDVVAGPDAVNHLLLLTTAITLTPGTAVIDADPETGTLRLHLLHADTEAAVTRHVAKLVSLATEAFPPDRPNPSIPEVSS